VSDTVTDGLVIEQDGPVLRLTLDRPAKRNALTDGMVAALADAIEAAGNDEGVRVILLTATGDHFCSGFDIVSRNAGKTGNRPRAGSIQRRLPSQAHRLIPVICQTQVPVVTAVRGWAAGIGLALALAADVTVAAEDATFWAPFAARGFTPDSGLTWLLPRRVGEVRARRLLLLGERINGEVAAGWGLIDSAVPAPSLDEAAERLVRTLSESPTVALGLTKWLLHSGRELALDGALRNEAFAMELSSRSEDFREGMAAFTGKRAPKFTGR
jgi:2-(1,2-epoxy-1,2-dihydrophenyl)acetyl-CoA isomerase